MLIYPAIDLIDGRCVRLLHGRFDQATQYGDPVQQIAAYARAGAEWAHVVDLDGARAGAPQQVALIAQLARGAAIKVQCGGGVRTSADIERLFDAGVSRVVIGSAAARNPAQARDWLGAYGAERICCALDVRRIGESYEVAINAWRDGAGLSLDALLREFDTNTLRHVLVTDVSRDGAMSGPNIELIASIAQAHPQLQVQASGGVAALGDLALLRGAGAHGAIIGRALYEGAFTLEAALAS